MPKVGKGCHWVEWEGAMGMGWEGVGGIGLGRGWERKRPGSLKKSPYPEETSGQPLVSSGYAVGPVPCYASAGQDWAVH